jgi:ABC-type multidrug transport system permease subunit
MILLLGFIAYYMIGLNPPLIKFFKFLLVLVLFNMVATSICFLIGTAFHMLSVANLFASLIILFSMLFGGFLLNKDHIPVILSWLQYISFFNYAFEALIVNELEDMTLITQKMGIDIQVPGRVLLSTFGFHSNNFSKDVTLLIFMLFLFLTLSLIALKFLVKERR